MRTALRCKETLRVGFKAESAGIGYDTRVYLHGYLAHFLERPEQRARYLVAQEEDCPQIWFA